MSVIYNEFTQGILRFCCSSGSLENNARILHKIIIYFSIFKYVAGILYVSDSVLGWYTYVMKFNMLHIHNSSIEMP